MLKSALVSAGEIEGLSHLFCWCALPDEFCHFCQFQKEFDLFAETRRKSFHAQFGQQPAWPTFSDYLFHHTNLLRKLHSFHVKVMIGLSNSIINRAYVFKALGKYHSPLDISKTNRPSDFRGTFHFCLLFTPPQGKFTPSHVVCAGSAPFCFCQCQPDICAQRNRWISGRLFAHFWAPSPTKKYLLSQSCAASLWPATQQLEDVLIFSSRTCSQKHSVDQEWIRSFVISSRKNQRMLQTTYFGSTSISDLNVLG